MAGYGQAQRFDFGEDSEQLATETGILILQLEETFLEVDGIHGATFEGPGMDCGLELLLARALEEGCRPG